MKNVIVDSLKSIARLIGVILYLIGYVFYKGGEKMMNLKYSKEIQDEKLAIEKAELEKIIVLPIKKKRIQRKKKVVEEVVNEA